MKRSEAYWILNAMHVGATEEQREALSIAQNDIEFVDLMDENLAPVVRGRWIKTKEWATKAKYQCSVCGREIMSAVKVNMEKYPHCHCGAKMEA